MTKTPPPLDHAITVARDVRTGLLRLSPEMPRDLAGQCGLVSMLVANALEDPRALRVGFFMAREKLFGQRARLPNRHAWCRIGPTIVDATATQFTSRVRAIHVASAIDDDRYVETDSAEGAIDEIMAHWRGRKLPVYRHLAKKLRRCLRRQEGNL